MLIKAISTQPLTIIFENCCIAEINAENILEFKHGNISTIPMTENDKPSYIKFIKKLHLVISSRANTKAILKPNFDNMPLFDRLLAFRDITGIIIDNQQLNIDYIGDFNFKQNTYIDSNGDLVIDIS